MSKAEGKKIVVKFTEEILEPAVDMSDLDDMPYVNAYTSGTYSGSEGVITTPTESENGSLLFLIIGQSNDDEIPALPGWTLLDDLEDDNYARTYIYYKLSDGGEETYNLLHSSMNVCWLVYSINFGDSANIVYDYSDGYWSYPNSPELISGYAPNTKTLWIAACVQYARTLDSVAPNFPDNQVTLNQGLTYLVSSTKTSTESSENPEQYPVSTERGTHIALTIAIKNVDSGIEDGRISGELKKGFNISGNDPLYTKFPSEEIVGSIGFNYFPTKVSFHPTVSKALLLEFLSNNNFKNSEGNIIVNYDKVIGSLEGVGGVVESFNESFTPEDLVRVPNPFLDSGYFKISSCCSFSLIEVNYIDAFNNDDYFKLSVDLSITMTHIDDLDV